MAAYFTITDDFDSSKKMEIIIFNKKCLMIISDEDHETSDDISLTIEDITSLICELNRIKNELINT